VASSENIIVAMMHTNPKGESKLRSACSLPLTGVRCVKRIVTNLAVLDITSDGFLVKEKAPATEISQIVKATEGSLIVPDYVPVMKLD